MSGGDRLKEHISTLSGAERLYLLASLLFSPGKYVRIKNPRLGVRMDTRLTEELRHRRTTAFQLEWWRWMHHSNLWRMNYTALLLIQSVERNPREVRKVIIGNPLPYIMLMSTKLLPLNQLDTNIFILLMPLMWEVNLITPGRPAFGSLLPKCKMYAEGGIQPNPFIESSDKGQLAFSSHSTCQTGENSWNTQIPNLESCTTVLLTPGNEHS